MDALALAQYEEIHNWIADRWTAGTMDIIRETNKPMYDRMVGLTDSIDQMLPIEKKNKKQKEQYVKALAAFRRIHELAMVFASCQRKSDISFLTM